jgi:hypothetical protein
MTRSFYRPCVLATCLAAFAWSAAAIGQDEASVLQQLLAENKNLTVQLDKAKKTETDIGKAELSLKGWDTALKAAREEVRRNRTAIVKDFDMVNQRARETGCPWGGSSRDEGYVSSCNGKADEFNAMFRELSSQGASLQEFDRKLDQKQQEFTKATMSWFKKKKANNDDLQTLYAANADWQRRYNAFVFRSEAYERLKVTAPGAQDCETLSGNGRDAEKLRTASQCLQRLFDGARRR